MRLGRKHRRDEGQDRTRFGGSLRLVRVMHGHRARQISWPIRPMDKRSAKFAG